MALLPTRSPLCFHLSHFKSALFLLVATLIKRDQVVWFLWTVLTVNLRGVCKLLNCAHPNKCNWITCSSIPLNCLVPSLITLVLCDWWWRLSDGHFVQLVPMSSSQWWSFGFRWAFLFSDQLSLIYLYKEEVGPHWTEQVIKAWWWALGFRWIVLFLDRL